jgi:hypothetical protein
MKKTLYAFQLKKAYSLLYNEIVEFFSMLNNYKSYRRMLRVQTAPCVPFIGVFVSDLTFLDEGNQNDCDVIDETDESHTIKLINLTKRRMLASALRDTLKFSSQKYALEPLPVLQKKLISPPSISENDLYR